MKYIYPAIFEPEGERYNVHFPDLPSCFTCGDSLENAIDMVNDALCMWLYHLEEEKRVIPAASHPKDIEISEENFVMAVSVDTNDYRRFYENKLISDAKAGF